MAQIEFLTKEDLVQLKTELIQEIRSLLKPAATETKEWLRSVDVQKMLKISPGILQNLRITGKLRFTRVAQVFQSHHPPAVGQVGFWVPQKHNLQHKKQTH